MSLARVENEFTWLYDNMPVVRDVERDPEAQDKFFRKWATAILTPHEEVKLVHRLSFIYGLQQYSAARHLRDLHMARIGYK